MRYSDLQKMVHVRVVYAFMAINVVQTVLLGLILLNQESAWIDKHISNWSMRRKALPVTGVDTNLCAVEKGGLALDTAGGWSMVRPDQGTAFNWLIYLKYQTKRLMEI